MMDSTGETLAGSDGVDTALARLLLAEGALPLGALQAALQAVRARRASEPTATLAGHLAAEGRIEPARLERCLARVHLGATAQAALNRPGAPPELADYELVRELARGGMGVVYEVVDRGTGARRALKTLQGSLGDAVERERFRREARALASLEHPHLVKIHSARLDGAVPYFVQELLEGGSLQARLRREGPLPIAEAVRILVPIAEAIEHAHRHGLLHRDLKPENVLFDERGQPRLVDFGLTRALRDLSHGLTATGAILGTPAYMAPEQAHGGKMDARVDVYGLGGVLYALLTGRAPFQGQTALALLRAVLSEAPVPPHRLRPDTPPALEAACLRALAKDPQQRFPSAEAFARAVEASLRAGPSQGSPRVARRLLVGLGGVLVLVLAVGFGLGSLGDGEEGGAAPREEAQSLPDATPRVEDPHERVEALVVRGEARAAADLATRLLATRPDDLALRRLRGYARLLFEEETDEDLARAAEDLRGTRAVERALGLAPGTDGRALRVERLRRDLAGKAERLSGLPLAWEQPSQQALDLAGELVGAAGELGELGPLGKRLIHRLQGTLAVFLVAFAETFVSSEPARTDAALALGEATRALDPQSSEELLLVIALVRLNDRASRSPPAELAQRLKASATRHAALPGQFPFLGAAMRYHVALAASDTVEQTHAAEAALAAGERLGLWDRYPSWRYYLPRNLSTLLFDATHQALANGHPAGAALAEKLVRYTRDAVQVDVEHRVTHRIRLVSALLLAGDPTAARVTCAQLTGAAQAVLLAECDLVEGWTERARARLDAVLADDEVEQVWRLQSLFARAHARALQGDTAGAHAEVQEAVRATAPGFILPVPWHRRRGGARVVMGRDWWPGAEGE